MDIDTLKAFSDHALAFSIQYLREHKNFNAMFQVLSASGVDVVVAGDLPQDVDWSVAKDLISGKVRELIKERQAEAVVNMSDGYVMKIAEFHPLAAAAKSGRFSMDQLERMGVAKRREAIVVSLETPIYTRVLIQQYYRNSAGAVILRELKDADSTDPLFRHPQGRFFNFFSQDKAASA